jgi:hypothetical protein
MSKINQNIVKKFIIYQLAATQLYGVILRILRQEQLAQDCL